VDVLSPNPQDAMPRDSKKSPMSDFLRWH